MAKTSGFARLKTTEAPPQQVAPQPPPSSKPGVQPNRIGMKTVIFYDLPEAVRELKRLGVDQDRTVQGPNAGGLGRPSGQVREARLREALGPSLCVLSM